VNSDHTRTLQTNRLSPEFQKVIPNTVDETIRRIYADHRRLRRLKRSADYSDYADYTDQKRVDWRFCGGIAISQGHRSAIAYFLRSESKYYHLFF